MPRQRKSLDITEIDIIAELDAIRERPDPRAAVFTPEQDAALWHARGPHQQKKIPWAAFKLLWDRRWTSVAEGTLRCRLAALVEQGGPDKEES